MKYVVVAASLAALCCAAWLYSWIRGQEAGNPRMQEIASYIREGAMAFLNREYRIVAFFILFMFVFLFAVIGVYSAGAFLFGALFSIAAGNIGMHTATYANVRTARAAEQGGIPAALRIAFRGGAVMGLCVAGLGLLGMGGLFVIAGVSRIELFSGFGLGASSIALFGRVGGGIYTKAADVGADLVGKVEAGIPEDDPRNPAVIADNVGDNVGDVAGMGSDLFESYVGSIVSAVTLAAAIPEVDPLRGSLFALSIAAAGILASLLSVFTVGGRNTKDPASALNRGTYLSGGLVVLLSFFLSRMLLGGLRAFGAVAAGLLTGILIGVLTEYYTSGSFRHVRALAEQCGTGAATAVIDGLALGMLSTVAPILLVCAGILAAFHFFGLYGIALAAVGMLSTTGIVVAVDAYGPISDNAGGIAEMAGLSENVREITDRLDAVGNTTAAVGKGFAIGSAALTALALFASYAQIAQLSSINLLDPLVVVGLLLGGMLPFLFSALTMKSVGRAAFEMIEEVRRQFRADRGIMEGSSRPDYARCVDISTRAALKEMLLPGVLAILSPILTGILLGPAALGGLLAGSLASGVLLAIMMSNAGGAWDNAKKYIEEGHCGGKGSEAHKAAVIGDTVGDPFKDTSGPSINILIKLMTIVSVTFLPFFL